MMPDQNPSAFKPQTADPRWFIWTIVFLVVAGISLASFIMFSDSGAIEPSPAIVTHVNKPNSTVHPTSSPQQ